MNYESEDLTLKGRVGSKLFGNDDHADQITNLSDLAGLNQPTEKVTALGIFVWYPRI